MIDELDQVIERTAVQIGEVSESLAKLRSVTGNKPNAVLVVGNELLRSLRQIYQFQGRIRLAWLMGETETIAALDVQLQRAIERVAFLDIATQELSNGSQFDE